MSMTRCWMITTAADEARFEREIGGDVGERGFERRGVEGGLDDGGDDLVLVGEDAEDRAFGDAGRLRDLAARHPVAVLEQQRHAAATIVDRRSSGGRAAARLVFGAEVVSVGLAGEFMASAP